MSISGIDSQIMVARTTDLSRDTSIQQRKGELSQEFMSIQAKALEVQEQQTVAEAAEAEMARLNPDDSSNSGADSEKKHGSKNERDEETPGPGNAVPSENHIIDIKI